MYEDSFCQEFVAWRKRNRIPMIKVSKAVQRPVGTLNAWLLGYNPLPPEMKDSLEQFMKEHGE